MQTFLGKGLFLSVAPSVLPTVSWTLDKAHLPVVLMSDLKISMEFLKHVLCDVTRRAHPFNFNLNYACSHGILDNIFKLALCFSRKFISRGIMDTDV